MQNYLKIFKDTNQKIQALMYADSSIYWDSQTEAPKGCFDIRNKRLSVLNKMLYQLSTNEDYLEAVEKLYEQRESMDKVLRHEIEEIQKEVNQIRKVPEDEYVKAMELFNESLINYFEAKAKSDYSIFEPYLDKVLIYLRKYAKWIETDELKGYDIFLDKYETGMTQKEYDNFFDTLREKLVPFVKKVASTKLDFNKSWMSACYPVDKQKEFSNYLQDVMCYDLSKGLMKESEHPFTIGIDTTNVRVTNHYYENLLTSSIFSAIHEMGHATYEMQVDPALNDILADRTASMGMHESQSRFYENIIGRSYEFWQRHYPKLVEIFPEQLGKVSLDDFYKGINLVECSLIRTEADELTYSLHVMVRYELEKRMIKGEIDIKDLPTEWNKMYKEYLGVDVPNDKEGILQDMHWSDGNIGYFPTYALGSAYAAQFYHKMSQEIDTKKAFGDVNLAQVNNWLKEKIHKHGSLMKPKEIITYATGEEFNPDYYVNYLIEKYSKIYNIK